MEVKKPEAVETTVANAKVQTEAPKTEAPKAPKVEAMPEQNGIRMPRAGTACAGIWEHATTMSQERKATVAIGDLLEVLLAQGYNQATIKTQYARWRKFHGVEGRIESEASANKKAEREEAKAKAKAEKEAKAKAREDAKIQKAKEKAEKAEAAKAAKEAKAKEKAEKAAKAKTEKEAKASEAAAQKAAKVADAPEAPEA